MSDLTKVWNQDLVNALGNQCQTKATLAINAGGAATVRTTGATIYTVGGVMYTKAALTAQSAAVTHRFDGAPVTTADPGYVQPINTTVIYVLALNAGGTVAVVQGTFAGQQVVYGSDLSKVVTAGGGVPALPAGYTPFGAIKVATNGVATFNPGTTALDAAGLTVTFFDLGLLPVNL